MNQLDPTAIGAALDRRVDPVAEAEEYRAVLLGLLGDQDPAQVQAELADHFEAIVEEAGPHLRTRPAPSEWSVLQILGHILDAEITSAARYRWVLAHDEPPLIGYDQDLWVDRLHVQDEDPDDVLSLFRALRTSHIRLWTRASEADRSGSAFTPSGGRRASTWPSVSSPGMGCSTWVRYSERWLRWPRSDELFGPAVAHETDLLRHSGQIWGLAGEAWEFFGAQPASYHEAAIWWVASAKRPETR